MPSGFVGIMAKEPVEVVNFQFKPKEFEANEEVPPSKRAKKEPVHIDLPDELWIKILQFMKNYDVFKNFALTCKRFNTLSLDTGTIKYLDLIRVCELDRESVLKVLKRSKVMTKIEIHNCTLFADILSTSLKSSSRLKSVTIDCKNDKKQVKKINTVLEKFGKNLEVLSLGVGGYFYITEAAIIKLTNLKILDLHGDTQLTSKNLIALATNSKIESLTAIVKRQTWHSKLFWKQLVKH